MTKRETDINFNTLDAKHPKRIQHQWSDRAVLQKAATDLQIRDLSKLSIDVTLTPEGKHDWKLDGHVGASLVQACVITLQDVKDRLDVPVHRRYVRHFAQYEAEHRSETELHEDVDPLPETLNIFDLTLEVVALNLTPFPKHRDAKLPTDLLTAEPDEQDSNPFAVLQTLKGGLDSGS